MTTIGLSKKSVKMVTSNEMKPTSLLSRFSFHLISISVLLATILLTFKQLPQTFYQQDEWLGLGQLMAIGWGNILNGNNIIQLLFGDGRPLTRVWGTVFYEAFSLQPIPFAIYSIMFHFVNTVLVYFIINRLIKNKFFALLGALYFAVADVAHQTVTWFGASFGEQPSSLFIFLSVLLFLFFVENKNKVYLYTAFICAAISLYFKENGIFLFPLFSLAPFIFDKKYPIKKLTVSYLPVFLFAALFVGYRLFEMLFINTPFTGSVYASATSQSILPTLFLRVIMYPLTSFSLSFIPYPIATFLAAWTWKLYYPYITQRPDLVFQTAILDMIAIVFSGFILLMSYCIACKKEYTKPVVFALVFFVLSILPYVVISKTYAYLEPRYFYISLLSSGILIGCLFSYLYFSLQRKGKLLLAIPLIVYAVFIRFNISVIRHDIAVQVDIANERKSFMKQLYSYLPTLTKDTNIFYFTGSTPYVVDNNFTPFQNGFGYTLMVLYYKSGEIPKYLPTTQFLWNLGEEGVKKMDGKTFGYFNNYDDLKKYTKQKQLDPDSIYSFYYDAKQKKLYNITTQVQKGIVE